MVLPVGFEPTLLWSLAICLCQLGYESIYRLLFHYQLLTGSSYPSLFGTPGGSRTHNILILSQSSLPVGLPGQKMETGGSAPPHRTLSADPIHNSRIDAISILGFHIWCRRLESNQRPRIFSPLLIPPQLPRHIGTTSWDRTSDIRDMSPILCQLSYRGIWSPRSDSD